MCRLSKLDICLHCLSSAMFAGNPPLFTPDSFLLCQRPVNKTLCLFEDEREKMKNKNKQKKHIHSTHFLIRHLCFYSGELFFRAFEMHEANSLPGSWPFRNYCCLLGDILRWLFGAPTIASQQLCICKFHSLKFVFVSLLCKRHTHAVSSAYYAY